MPELPEVETIARQLDAVLPKQKIVAGKVLRDKSFEGTIEQIIGRKITSVSRKGKVIIVTLDQKLFLLIHLKMTGQLIYQDSRRFKRIVGGHPSRSWLEQLPDKHTRVVLELENGTLFFNDQRVFGWVKVVDGFGVNGLMGKLPPDIIDPEITPEFFYKLLQSSRRPVKVVLMDSSRLGGVGNIYANDSLFDAGIDPRRPANSLSKKDSDRLLTSTKKIIDLGIQLGGATASDDKFVQTTGMGGSYQHHFLTYERAGQNCKTAGCAGTIQKVKLGGRGTYFCPECQK